MPDVLVAPSLVMGGTDVRYYAAAGLSPNIYRMLPLRVPTTDLKGPHGVNERISIDAYREMISFYVQLMRNFSGS
jgi:carboxypeptidase PM20D1